MNSDICAEFVGEYSFELDDFQQEACSLIAQGRSVVVAAPTGSGKTIPGEYACYLAYRSLRKCFYTTPIKALSNQKYHDLVERYGSQSVGLLTGDQSVNPTAPIVVMTTEVLRNMLYARSATLEDLGYVVLDEVHYLADRFRGAVWEEVILGLDQSVQLICLSATVSNAEEFAEWIDEVRTGVHLVISEKRPVPLFQHVLVGRRLVDLFVDKSGKKAINPELVRLAKEESRLVRDDRRHLRSAKIRQRIQRNRTASSEKKAIRSRLPRHDGAVEALAKNHLLPAIFFIFSRQGCDQAVSHLLGSDLDLTTAEEKEQIFQLAHRLGSSLREEDRRVVGWDRFIHCLMRGIAAHHAGILPIYKTIIERAFAEGYLKVVFATETLALGINMPARTVVIEKLVKYNGQSHAELTPGEFTQLVGRAGRRGIDTEGHAVIFWRTGMDPKMVGALASRRTYPLRSSFTPSYNMAVNLVGSVGRRQARSLLEQSFAQFQADRSVVTWAKKAQQHAQQAALLWGKARCERGDIEEYARLRDRISIAESEMAKMRKRDRRDAIRDCLASLSEGDVIWIPSGKYRGWAAVIATRRHEGFPYVMTMKSGLVQLGFADLNVEIRPFSKIRIPRRFDPHSAKDRKAVLKALRLRAESLDEDQAQAHCIRSDQKMMTQIEMMRIEMRAHPVHRCEDREIHARYAEEALRLERDKDEVRHKTRQRLNSIASRFDRICAVLDSLGYIESDELTEAGQMLARIYNDHDLLICEAIRRGIFDSCDLPQLAAVLSTMVYEARPGYHLDNYRMPDRGSEKVQSQLRFLWAEIGRIESDHRVQRVEMKDIGFSSIAYSWAAGASLSTIMDGHTMPIGDVIRWLRQVIDLASQIAQICDSAVISQRCRDLVAVMKRGLVDQDLTYIEMDDDAGERD